MIEHVYARTLLCDVIEAVYVATCDEEIRAAVEGFGGRVIMTSASHERASDRVAEAIETLQAEIVVMVQGDEPMVTPEMIHAAVAPMLSDERILCVNLIGRVSSVAEFEDPNTIKVVRDRQGFALYFSREPIPTRACEPFEQLPVFKQICVIPFRRHFLEAYGALAPTPLERAESIDMLRILEHGYRVKVVETSVETHAVDTPSDLQHVDELMQRDPLAAQYLRTALEWRTS